MKFIGDNVNHLYLQAMTNLLMAPIQPSRVEATKELTHVMFQLNNPRQRLITMRDINPAFAFVEVLWIMAGGNNVKYLEFWNKRMRNFADGDLLYGAYGARLGCHHFWEDTNFSSTAPGLSEALYIPNSTESSWNQLQLVKETLERKSSSRQAVLQIWNVIDDLPVSWGAERAKDIPCNIMSHLLVRDNHLHWLQVMRSNDAVWGFPYNIIQWTMLQEIVAGWLGLELGPFVLVSDSFHIYEKHWNSIEPICMRFPNKTYSTESYATPFSAWWRNYYKMIITAWELTTCDLGDEYRIVHDCIAGVNSCFEDLLYMLGAEAARIKGDNDWASNIASHMSFDSAWGESWLLWFEAKNRGSIL